MSRFQHEIVLAQVRSEGPCHVKSDDLGRLRRQTVAIGAECEYRLDRVPPIRKLSTHVQREVELRRRDLARGRAQGAALAEVSPEASFAFTRLAISSSAVTSAA